MAKRTIEQKLLLFERNLEVVRLLLKNGSLYEGTVEKDLLRGSGT
jgi:hypothetical protein